MSEHGQKAVVRPYLQLSLSGEIAVGWELKDPILLDMELDELGEYVVFDDSLETYGVGASPQEAADDFTSMLLDQYKQLSESEEVLSTHYRILLERLRAILSKSK